MAPTKTFQSIAITGGSSGIGQALALELAGPGVMLHLSGRTRERLDAVSREVTARGGEVHARVLDVTDADATARWIEEADAHRPLDLVVANAGISGGTGGADEGEPARQTREIFATNLDGVLNTVLPSVPLMASRRRGQIGIMSSLAGFRGLPTAPAYCASKAAVRSWGDGMRGSVAPHGIGVSVICPGYVTSRMTDANDFPMPFKWPADRAARVIHRGLARNRSRIAFPWPMLFGVWLLQALPAAWPEPILNRLPAKGARTLP